MGEIVSYRSNGGTSEGYLALPETGTGPGVIVIQEWWGLVPHITSLADRFADAGFVALAPDLYHGEHTTEPDEAGKMMMGLAMDQAAKDMAGAAAHLSTVGATGKVGAVGFCMGGSLALWSATLSDQIVATVGFYPPVPWERMSPQLGELRRQGRDDPLLRGRRHEFGARHPDRGRGDHRRPAASARSTTTPAPSTRSSTTTGPRSTRPTPSALAWARTLDFFRAKLG